MNKPLLVCAHDPRQPEAVGAVVSDDRSVHKGTANGAVYLPVDQEPLYHLPLGGFVRRSWGKSGWAFDLNRAEGGAPLALQVRAGNSKISWAAEVAASPILGSRPYATGKLQLALNRTAVGVLMPGFSQGGAIEGFQVKPNETVILRGAVQLNTLLDGFVALHLWGVCNGVAVRWLAVSQSEVSGP